MRKTALGVIIEGEGFVLRSKASEDFKCEKGEGLEVLPDLSAVLDKPTGDL